MLTLIEQISRKKTLVTCPLVLMKKCKCILVLVIQIILLKFSVIQYNKIARKCVIIQKEIVVLRDKINFVLDCRIRNSLSEFTREYKISFVEKNLKYAALSWKISQPFGDRISRGAYRTIDFSIANAAKRRNIIGIPSI